MALQYYINGNELIIEGNRINKRLMVPEGEDAQTWAADYVATLVDAADKTIEFYVSVEDLYDLFAETEQEAFENSANARVKVLLRRLSIKRWVRVSATLMNILSALESTGFIGVGRASEIASEIENKKVTR